MAHRRGLWLNAERINGAYLIYLSSHILLYKAFACQQVPVGWWIPMRWPVLLASQAAPLASVWPSLVFTSLDADTAPAEGGIFPQLPHPTRQRWGFVAVPVCVQAVPPFPPFSIPSGPENTNSFLWGDVQETALEWECSEGPPKQHRGWSLSAGMTSTTPLLPAAGGSSGAPEFLMPHQPTH